MAQIWCLPPPWILDVVPGASASAASTAFDGCRRFARAGPGNATAPPGSTDACAATLFDRESLVPCDRHVYENANTIVYDFDLGCDEWKRSLVGSARTLGALVGNPVSGLVSDRWGRRAALVLTAVSAACIGLARLAATTYATFVAAEFAESALGYSYPCAYILLMELVGPKHRKYIAAAMNTFFSLGSATMALLAWAVPNWKYLTLILYVPQLLTLGYWWAVCESARWYVSKERYEESETVLRKVARVNKKVLSEKSLLALRKAEKLKHERITLKKSWLIVQVFRHKTVLIRCLVSPMWWVTGVLIYYGLSMNAINVSGDGYANFAAASLMEIPGCWAAVLLMDKIGRKPVLMGSFWICAVCQMGFIYTSQGIFELSLILFLIGKLCTGSVMVAIYTYTAELFPTAHRHTLFAFCSMMGRLGAIVAPLTPTLSAAVWVHLPFATFGALSLVSGLLVLATPETLGAALPDSMLEAAHIGTSQPSTS